MESNTKPDPLSFDKIKSRIESAISISFIVLFLFLLEGTGWLLGDAIDATFGTKSGAFTLFVVLPVVLLFSVLIVLFCGYFVTARLFSKPVAEQIFFGWKK